jgi:hypothetical protein
MKQVITVTLELAEKQKPYLLKEHERYIALEYFFEDIGYAVVKIKNETEVEPCHTKTPIR